MLKTPAFYFSKISVLSIVLLPFSILFYILSVLRNLLINQVTLKDKFVICIGNATVGGAGKTPSAIFVGKLLREMDQDFCFISKGYGRRTKGFIEVKDVDLPMITGDEPLLLKKHGKVFVFSKYKDIVENLPKIKERIIIMDDGMQNPKIKKDITILVVDSILQFGNSMLLPAGPMRESLKSALKKSDAIFCIGPVTNQLQTKIKTNLPIFEFSKSYKFSGTEAERVENFIAVSGLANNVKFFSGLKEMELNVVANLEYDDHHCYTKHDIINIRSHAQKLHAKIITTEKDFIKLKVFGLKCFVLKLYLSCKQKGDLLLFLQNKLTKNK